MNRLYKVFFILISGLTLAVLPDQELWSCGPDLNTDETMFLLFQRDLPEHESLAPFYYAEHFMNDVVNEGPLLDMKRNCKEWVAFTAGKVKEKDVYNIEYNLSPDAFTLCFSTGDWGSLADNGFIRWLLKKENRPSLDYFAYAKKVEHIMFLDSDPWEKTALELPRPEYYSYIDEGRKKCEAQTGFLKERYAFQVEKLLYYKDWNFTKYGEKIKDTLADTRDLTEWYEKHLLNKPTIVADWGLLYYALSVKNERQRDLCLLQTFDKSEEKKGFVYQCLRKDSLSALEAHVSDPKTRSLIHAYIGIKTPGRALREIKQVYEYNPQSPYLQLLVGREINKLEDWIWSSEMKRFNSEIEESIFASQHPGYSYDTYDKDYAAKNREKDKKYMREFRSYLESIAKKDVHNSDFLKLAIVHLSHIDKNFEEAAKYLKTIGNLKNKKQEIQRLVELTISAAYTEDISSPETQSHIQQLLTALEKSGAQNKFQPDEIGYDASGGLLPQIYLLLSRQYQKKGDVVKAGLLFGKARLIINEYHGGNFDFTADGTPGYYFSISYFDKYAEIADIDSLLRFKHRKNKTAFEKRISPLNWPDDNSYLDLKGTKLVREGKLEEAERVFNRIPANFWVDNYEFKDFLCKSSVASVGTLLPVSDNEKKYTIESKRLIVSEMVQLQHKLNAAGSNEEKAKVCFLLGNCFYNISRAGKDWMVFSYGKSSYEIPQFTAWRWWAYSFTPNDKKYEKKYYECKDASDLYQQALKLSGNKELKAKCILMLALCDKNAHRYLAEKLHNGDDGDEYRKPYFSKWLSILKRNYSNTMVYENSATECPDVEEFLKNGKIN